MLEHRSLRRHLDFGFTSVAQTYSRLRLASVIVSKKQLEGRQTIGRCTTKKKSIQTCALQLQATKIIAIIARKSDLVTKSPWSSPLVHVCLLPVPATRSGSAR